MTVIAVSSSFQILVIILSVTLAILLLLSIGIAIQVLKITKHIHRMVAKAEHITENIESMSETAKNTVRGVSFGKLALSLVNEITKHVNQKNSKKPQE